MRIDGIGAIVTGGASGLGAGTAEMLARNGAKVTIFDLNTELGTAKAAELGGHFVKVDVSSEESVNAALAEAEEKHGVARVLVNCAGIATAEKMIDRNGQPLPLERFAKVVGINLVGTFNVMSKFAARLHTAEPVGADGERGVVINTASVAAFEGQVGQPAYGASKGGVMALTLPAARELARYGIRVMTIAPGIFWTPMMAGLPPEAQESLGKQIPFPSRLGQPTEYAQLAEAIIANPMLNGETIRLDGAIRMAPR
ncbi:SDR family NAD(P)-dependent oxidoreductase [Sphingomonas solaris]|uniref:SDR family NAD(P)-dependent oxidoreductase n=1 Tax=Alterirhizorhabdus solaris TaxID=2529389 RepID=A0A558QY01_9SPHN|nr:SDR family NAD(P)-dependent oxidoreductase [Sphingomonas solaris]TVV72011.1 SDR family NAD(P)-dependent oxidoreductase [Sphingomonas solaris]